LNYYLLTSVILAIVAGVFSLARQLQMLQQNSYFASRYSAWLSDNSPLFPMFLFAVSSVLFNMQLYLWQAVLLAVYLLISVKSAITYQKKSIKKLVFTARIKRLFAAAIIVYLAFLSVYVIYRETIFGKAFTVVIFLLAFIPPVMTYIAWALTLPIEKAVAKWYVNDAKRVLKAHKGLKVIGITGSYGKTSTKFILSRILSEKFNTVCTPQSFNTPMGVVRTIREKLLPQTEIFVCEMGAKNVGDIKEICDIVSPDIAVITSVGAQHLETFKTVDNVFKTKFELADAVALKNGDIFVNGDSKEIYERTKTEAYKVYGTSAAFDLRGENITYGKDGAEFEVTLKGEKLKLSTRLLGLHNIINIIGAVYLADSLGVSKEDIKYAVASLKPTEHRLEMKSCVKGSVMIDDAYNANPEGCLEAVRVLGSFDGMKKVIITPGLIELGDKEYESNFALGLEAAKICDIIIFVGKNRSKPMVDAVNTTEFNKDNMFVAESFAEAMSIYSNLADKNTALLVENDLPDNYLN